MSSKRFLPCDGRKVLYVLLFVGSAALGSFPENLQPISKSSYNDVPNRVFVGGADPDDDVPSSPPHRLQNIQVIKSMKVRGRDVIAVASRDCLYLLDPDKLDTTRDGEITYDQIITWQSNNESKLLCKMKGGSDELCYNYLSVIEAKDAGGNELLLCGSNAIDPMCTTLVAEAHSTGRTVLENGGEYFDGKQRCPHGPHQPSAAMYADGEYYAATFQHFSKLSQPIFSRNMATEHPLRTANRKDALNAPSFVHIHDYGDRVLLYMNEFQVLPTGEKRNIAKVAQVCKNDVGGVTVMERTWTSYIKARLNCSYNGFYLDVVHDVSDPVQVDGVWKVYGVFSTPEHSLAGSALCSFTFDAIDAAFGGRFGPGQAQKGTFPPSKDHHPSRCLTAQASDAELVYIRAHATMEKQAEGELLLTNQGWRWSATAFDLSAGPNNVTMLFVGTEHGHVIRALGPSRLWRRGAIIEDLDAFDATRCVSGQPLPDDRRVKKLIVDQGRNVLVVAFRHCVITLPLRACARHRCESSCVGSADPYCGWSSEESACVEHTSPAQRLRQDVTSALTAPQMYDMTCGDDDVAIATITSKSAVAEEPGAVTLYRHRQSNPGDESSSNPVVVLNSAGVGGDGGFSLLALMLVAGGSAIGALTFAFCFLRCRRRCRRHRRGEAGDDFHRKQMAIQRMEIDGRQRSGGSLQRKFQHSYCGLMGWLKRGSTSMSTPMSTPRVSGKEYRARRSNDYTDAPTLRKDSVVASARRSRHGSATSSPQPAAQPLLAAPDQNAFFTDATLPSTAVLYDAVTGTIHTPSSSSSGGSPPKLTIKDAEVGAAETGVLPTASAKMRRRNERATREANAIMRESSDAVQRFEHVVNTMMTTSTGHHHHQQQQQQPRRSRLDSSDSGKGESPRNSLQNDFDQQQGASSSRQPRPTSLHLHRVATQRQQQRARLHSEPGEISVNHHHPSPIYYQQHRVNASQRPMTSSLGHQHVVPCRSQPTTPVDVSPTFDFSVPGYGTLPAQPAPSGDQMTGRRRHPSGGGNAFQQVTTPRQQLVEGYHAPATTQHTGMSAPTPNRYPSMLVRGPHANKPHTAVPGYRGPNPPPPVTQQQRVAAAPAPKNYYPSLPVTCSTGFSNPQPPPPSNGNSYVDGFGFERPATLHRREKLPSVMRQASLPASHRPSPVFVPPPAIPCSDAV